MCLSVCLPILCVPAGGGGGGVMFLYLRFFLIFFSAEDHSYIVFAFCKKLYFAESASSFSECKIDGMYLMHKLYEQNYTCLFNNKQFSDFQVSYFEIYMDKIRDLLDGK